jgi:hypothetical protein
MPATARLFYCVPWLIFVFEIINRLVESNYREDIWGVEFKNKTRDITRAANWWKHCDSPNHFTRHDSATALVISDRLLQMVRKFRCLYPYLNLKFNLSEKKIIANYKAPFALPLTVLFRII